MVEMGIPQTQKLLSVMEEAKLLSSRSEFVNSDNLFYLMRRGFIDIVRNSGGALYCEDESDDKFKLGINGELETSFNAVKLESLDSGRNIELKISVRDQNNNKVQSKYSAYRHGVKDCLALKTEREDRFGIENQEIDHFIFEKVLETFLNKINSIFR